MELIPTFVKRLTIEESRLNHVSIPHALCVRYGATIPRGVKLVVRNGYSVWLDFNNNQECFEGIRSFYQFLNIGGGETLLFEHCGGFQFKVQIFNIYGCEMKYPTMPNIESDFDVMMGYGGWSFLQHLSWGRERTDCVVIPWEFLELVNGALPSKVYYQVSNGYEIVGSCSDNGTELKGLVNICNMLNIPNLNVLNMLIFKYDGVSRFRVMAIDESLLQMSVAPTLVEVNYAGNVAFRFVVKQFQIASLYEYGVDIPAQYRSLSQRWSKKDYITAYVGFRCWKLEIRQRRLQIRTTINEGWTTFRTDLQLEEGDLCVFEWMNDTIRNFSVRIVKANGVGA